jgi:hypothetical protein
MNGGLDFRAHLGVAAIIVCTFALWLILGASAELARLIAGAAVSLAAGFWSALDSADSRQHEKRAAENA